MKFDPHRRTAARIVSLMQIKDVTRHDAKVIRAIWSARSVDQIAALLHPDKRAVYLARMAQSKTQIRMQAIDVQLGTCGIEQCTEGLTDFFYCNAGDMYAPTVVFRGLAMRAGCVADYIETRRAHDV